MKPFTMLMSMLVLITLLGALHLIPVCNKHGLTPLLQASNRRNSEKVKCLIQRPEITKEQKIEALELLGASIITKCDPGIERGFDYIKNGMEERLGTGLPIHLNLC